MPLVFVHGVNNRDSDPDYQPGVDEKSQYFTKLFAPNLGTAPATLNVLFPYWGDLGVKFRWDQASLPKDEGVALAVGDSGPFATRSSLWGGDVVRQYGPGADLPTVFGKEDFETALDLIWDTAAQAGLADPATLASHYRLAMEYAETNPAPKWAVQAKSNAEFLDGVRTHVPGGLPAVSLGLRDFYDQAGEAMSRFCGGASAEASALGLRLWRQEVHRVASRFIGDILVYMDRSKTPSEEIAKRVGDALVKARDLVSPSDPTLYVVGHSLGGVVTYDVLTSYRKDIEVDCLITVGSQVALFEEMTLYRESRAGVPANPPQDRLPRPPNIRRWLNVYDMNDVFSFVLQGVFKHEKGLLEDYGYSTGYGLTESHCGYFRRPSFYRRLAARLSPPAP